jgi:hypothetical protein
MRILIYNTASWGGFDAEDYKSKLKDFKYEEVRNENGRLRTYIEINSFEDLVKLSEVVDQELIIDFRKSKKNRNDEPFIEIYDDWRE